MPSDSCQRAKPGESAYRRKATAKDNVLKEFPGACRGHDTLQHNLRAVARAFAAGRALRTDGMLVLAKPEISHVYTHGARLP
jgi:hypothetical protein